MLPCRPPFGISLPGMAQAIIGSEAEQDDDGAMQFAGFDAATHSDGRIGHLQIDPSPFWRFLLARACSLPLSLSANISLSVPAAFRVY